MTKAGIQVFIDNERLHVGEVIGDDLMCAIDDSKIFMPIFSESYASSKWCFHELQRIMMGRPGQEVIPIFYKVSPDDVKLRTRLYSDDLEVLEKEHGTDKVDLWRKCLKEVCKIKGLNLEENQGQGKLIERIVQEVLYKTKKRYMNVTDHLVGIEGQIEAIMKLLDDQIDHVRFVIIHGMGGIGKTTLAKVIFNDVSSKFEGCSFLSNVRKSSQGNGIVKLQQQILNDVLRMSVREIVRRDGKSSRIWIHEEAFHMISNKKGTRDVISLDLGELPRSFKLKNAAFKELVKLRVLRLEGGNLVGDFSNCFSQLMWLQWRSFPSRRRFQAKNFSPPNLVLLNCTNTNINERWSGWKGLLGSKLKYLELSDCGGLTRTPDFSTCLGLGVLVLEDNNRLIEIDSSIGKLELLLHLGIKGSPKLRGLPQPLALLKRMEKLIVVRDVLEEYPVKFHLPIKFDNFKSLCHLAMEGVELESLPKGIGQLKLLKYLSLARCRHLMILPESVLELGSLVELDLQNCFKLEQIPSEIENLFSLRVLNLSNTGIVELPSSVIRLSHLQDLSMNFCRKLRKVEQLPTCLSYLSLPYFSLRVVPDFSNLVNIVQLELHGNINYHGAPIMDEEEDRWTRFRSLTSIERLPKIKRLVIEVELGLSCSVVQFLSHLPHNLSELILKEFRATTLDLSLFPNLSELCIHGLLSDEIELRCLEVLGNLEKIVVRNCQSLARLSIPSCPKELNYLGIADCPKLVEVEGVSRLESLQTLMLLDCPSLPRLSNLSNLGKMNSLIMHNCPSIEKIPPLPRTENPFYLTVRNCGKLRDFIGPPDLSVDIIEGDQTGVLY